MYLDGRSRHKKFAWNWLKMSHFRQTNYWSKCFRDNSLKESPRLWADSIIFEFPTLFLHFACPSKTAGNSNILESAHNRGNSFKELSLGLDNFFVSPVQKIEISHLEIQSKMGVFGMKMLKVLSHSLLFDHFC